MAKSAVLNVSVLVDAAKAATGLNEAAGKFESFGKKAVGFIAGAFALDKIGDGVKAVVTAASDMEQAVGGTEKIFGTSAQIVHQWASDTSDDFRVPAVAAEKFATSLGNSLIQTGKSTTEAAANVKELGMVAADLAAAYGGSVVDALDAVNAALSKGEWERLESFGVTVKASDVAAEMDRIAASFGGLTDASRPIIEQQARINLLLREAAPAAGAAAEEANSFASRMDSLKEKLGNAAAEIGGPLLDALGGLADGLASAVGSFAPAVTGVAGFVSNLAALPGPVLAATAALAGLFLLAPRFVSFFSGIGAGMSGFMGQIRAMQTAAVTAGGSISTFAAGARVAGSSLLGALGGPWGIAFAVAAAAATFGLVKWAEAAAKSKAAADAANTAVAAFQSTLREGGNIKNTAFDQIAEGLKGLGSKLSPSQLAKRFGMTQNDLVEALIGGNPQSVIDKMNSVIAPMIAKRDQLLTDRSTFAAGQAMNPDIEALQNERDMIENLIPTLERANTLEKERKDLMSQGPYESQMAANARWAKDADDAADSTDDLTEATKALQAAADSTVVNTLLSQVKSDAEDASRAVDFFGATMDGVTGRFTGYEGAVQGMQDAIRSTGEAFKSAAEAGELDLDAVARWDVRTLSASESGSKLVTELSGLASAYQSNVGEAFTAAQKTGDLAYAISFAQQEASAGYTDFMAMATAAGLTGEQAESAAAKLGIFNGTELDPKLFELIVEDQAARDALAALQAQGIEPKTVTMIADDLATPQIETALQYVDATGATVTIPLHADPKPADGVVDDFVSQNITTPDEMINVSANITKADAVVRQFMVAQRTASDIMVGANTSPANDAIRLVMTASRTASPISVGANTDPAMSAIRAVTNGAYTAVVRVVADTSSFFSTFNSLPGSRPVGAVPQLAAPVAAFSAPTLKSGTGKASSTATVSGPGLTINVSGALWPDDSARAVQNVLRRRDRRVGAIRI